MTRRSLGHSAFALYLLPFLGIATCCVAAVDEAAAQTSAIVRREFFVPVSSTAPAMEGHAAQAYVREVARGDLGSQTRGVVLFVHGAGTPSEVTFDVPYEDYSWMAYLAEAGFDVFATDMIGYGRSTRPSPMNDLCNLPKTQQATFVPSMLPQTCSPSFPTALTTMDSDWELIDAVVDHLRSLRGVSSVALVGWSQGGPRAAGYAAKHADKVSRLVVLAPAYNRNGPLGPPSGGPASSDGSMNVQSEKDFIANWDRQVECPAQYEPEVRSAVWSEMLASDPVGASWGTGVRRAPVVPTWGFNQAVVAKLTTPFLMVSGVTDKQVLPERVRQLYDDLGSEEKVFIDLACSSHNAMWERNHLLLFQASLDWLRDGKVDGVSRGMLRRGY
jgi:pimeloyl-ACP methyl ester carboxylesterase